MTEPDLAEVLAHGVTTVLAVWLGLTVLVSAGRLPGARVFALLAGLLATWSLAIIVQRTSGDPAVGDRLGLVNRIEDVAAFLLPAATLHIALIIAAEGHYSRLQRVVLGAAYALGLLTGLQQLVDPAHPIVVSPEPGSGQLQIAGIGGALLGWAFIAARLAIFAFAIGWLIGALRRAASDETRQRQLQVTLATVGVGVVGGGLRILPPEFGGPPALGVSLVTAAMVLAAYGVFAQRLFLSTELVARTFRRSVAGGLAVVAYVALIVAAERRAQELLGVELPLVTGLALIATLALFEPASDRARSFLGGGSVRDVVRHRLRRTLGLSGIAPQRSTPAIQAALARLSRTFDLVGAVATDSAGATIARHGAVPESEPAALRIALRRGDAEHGAVVFGPKRSGLPLTPEETTLLRLAASYLSAALELGVHHEQQIDALVQLAEQRETVAQQATVLSEALIRAEVGSVKRGLHVFALGPLRAEHDGQLIRSWGGAKAGTRQAEAVFAFLFDRGERGVSKDEVLELIWPDVDIERADLAFHRTLGGLRTTLEPQRRTGRGNTITFGNDRYRLHPDAAAWSDVAAFEDHVAAAGRAADLGERRAHLEQARALYRGDYLDDCPYFGDSAEVEERRGLLRERYVDVLLALGELYAELGDRPAATAALRQARASAADGCPPAEAALARLGAPV